MSPRSQEDDEEVIEEEEEEEQSERRQQRKKLKLMDESGLSEAQRRRIRQEQRALQRNLRETVDEVGFEELEQVRQQNNQVFESSVLYTREAVLDADTVDLIAAKYAQQIEKQILVPRFDAVKLVQKLTQKCTLRSGATQGYFDWKFLGTEAGICFNALPERVTFLAGALDQQLPVKVRAARGPRVKDAIHEEAEVQPESVDPNGNKSDADKLSAMEKAMRSMRKRLKARSVEEMANHPAGEAEEHPDIDGVQFLFNPQSFTQTVENIFNFSFLIKKGEAEIGVRPPLERRRSPTGAYVAYRTYDPESPNMECTQSVCRFTMADWRRLCQKQAEIGFEKGDLPHRTGTRHGRNLEASPLK